MRDILEQLLRSADVPNPGRGESLWVEYRSGADSPDPQAKRSADAAFATLLAWYGGSIYCRIWGFVRSEVADDVFQDVLAELHRRRASLATFADAHRWLRATADRRSTDACRRQTRRRAREARAARPEGDTTDADRSRNELQQALAAALAGLTPEQRQAVALHYFEGMDKQTTAEALGIHRETLARRLTDALDRLRKVMPAPAVLAAGGTVGVDATLSAAPLPSAARMAELAASAFVAPTGALSWSAAALLVVVTVCSAGLAGWALTRAPDSPPEVATPTPAPPPAPRPESVPDRNKRIFMAEVLPKQLTALKGLALGDGEVELASAVTYDTRLQCYYRLRHRVEGAPGLISKFGFVHNTVDRLTGCYFALREDVEPQSIDTKRPVVLWRSPLSGKEVVLNFPALEVARLAFHLLPQDERTATEWVDHKRRAVEAITPYLGDWYIRGKPDQLCQIWIDDPQTPRPFVTLSHRTAGRGGIALEELRVETPGWVAPLPLVGAATLAAEGREMRFDKPDEWWSREPIANTQK